MTLQEKLCRLRSREGLSQEDVAEKLNVSRQSVSKWETGQSVPELEKLLALSELYHVSLDDLAREERDPFTPQETVEPETVPGEERGEPAPVSSVRTIKQIRQRRGLTVLLIGAAMFLLALLLLMSSIGSTALLVVCFYGGVGVMIVGGALMLFHCVHPVLVVGWAIMLGLVLFDQFCGWSWRVLRLGYCLSLWEMWMERRSFSYLFYGLHGIYFYVLLVLTVWYLWEQWRKKHMKKKQPS